MHINDDPRWPVRCLQSQSCRTQLPPVFGSYCPKAQPASFQRLGRYGRCASEAIPLNNHLRKNPNPIQYQNKYKTKAAFAVSATMRHHGAKMRMPSSK
ncbi:hypothetical protein BA896_009815 [Janthinobacterium lividum]|uniref:Uncharacterized protein n=1 Tax=Janthinobacterium lividum TaxID=29581 RepID=A0A1E8PU67_9BURK|nr:hypothetical protein BA896_009815 [Janthinobacterium lividum]